MMFRQLYKGKSVFVTGHTGFKGSNLCLWLQELGAKVTGFALDPKSSPNHWDILGLEIEDIRGDIRDKGKLSKAVRQADPEIIFHLAAQPLVRSSYAHPIETWETNVMGTLHLLESARKLSHLQAIVIVTTDKVYQNLENGVAYKESDPIGGHDPYSASKSACEIAVESYRKSFFSHEGAPLIATARAGNVIGGGDWSEDRLIPDILRAIDLGTPLKVRSPHSTRPWQHVFDCLSGYLLLGQKLLEGNAACAESWNFGPDQRSNKKVIDVLEKLKREWDEISWIIDKNASTPLHEAHLLALDSSKANEKLNWTAVWPIEVALKSTVKWYQAWLEEGICLTHDQLMTYFSDAHENKMEWACHDDAAKYISKWIADHRFQVEK